MTLILSVPGRRKLDNGEPAELHLDRRGAVIGRSAHADWSLPDPKNHVSSRHCEISYRDGTYLLADRSTNGTFLNGSRERLGALHPIRDGDRITIGGYELLASLPGEHLEAAQPAPDTAPDLGWDDWEHADHSEDADADAAWGTAEIAAPKKPGGAPLQDYAWIEPAPALGVSPWASAPREAAPPSAVDVWGQLARDNDIAWSRGGFGPVEEVMGAWSPPAIANPAAEASEPTETPQPRAEAAPVTPATTSELWTTFAHAAGLSPEALRSAPPALLATAGAILRQMVTGLVLMVEARARAKAQLGVEGTSLELDGNNPLKFIRSPERALLQLLEPPQPGFMPAGRAIEDAFQDLQAHQMATLAAMRGALGDTLSRFSPAAIRDRQQTRTLWQRWTSGARDAALWRAYEQEFEGVIRGADEAFMDVFAKEFRTAYEQHVTDLKNRPRG
ncbi:type VI secretion system-associated FHA domain protein TagH [Sphingomonas sp. H39-1-10]|uniref:type VI secretion system-associated FHA domain protein TagH n=1 Tax=Sphingomonas pollutisoli TaxID=3030829 RepID=UPI0023B9D562|nr:type VI secretion system-associated FHA domain protein TagH [Sphingomonas pollutisoli]MDF0487863.1 type VI secretion system-associated FHA domain protein TagH [Sphingomonas pollutisoli]